MRCNVGVMSDASPLGLCLCIHVHAERVWEACVMYAASVQNLPLAACHYLETTSFFEVF